MVKDYPALFEKTDPYYEKAKLVSLKTQDIAEYLAGKDLTGLRLSNQTFLTTNHVLCNTGRNWVDSLNLSLHNLVTKENQSRIHISVAVLQAPTRSLNLKYRIN